MENAAVVLVRVPIAVDPLIAEAVDRGSQQFGYNGEMWRVTALGYDLRDIINRSVPSLLSYTFALAMSSWSMLSRKSRTALCRGRLDESPSGGRGTAAPLLQQGREQTSGYTDGKTILLSCFLNRTTEH